MVHDYLPAVLLGDICMEKKNGHRVFFHMYRMLTSYFHLTFQCFNEMDISYFTTWFADFRELYLSNWNNIYSVIFW